MTNCSCIKGNYNYYTEAIDKETIIYQDLSDWMIEEGYEYPTEYDIIVTPPTSSTPVSLTVKVGEINRITSTDIGTIKDGIYCYETTSCGKSYKRSQALFPSIECCIKTAWATLGSQHYPAIEEIERHVKLVTVNAELNNVILASRELKIAQKLVENLKCDCDC